MFPSFRANRYEYCLIITYGLDNLTDSDLLLSSKSAVFLIAVHFLKEVLLFLRLFLRSIMPIVIVCDNFYFSPLMKCLKKSLSFFFPLLPLIFGHFSLVLILFHFSSSPNRVFSTFIGSTTFWMMYVSSYFLLCPMSQFHIEAQTIYNIVISCFWSLGLTFYHKGCF